MEQCYSLLYEDSSLIAVSKAHGVHVIPDRHGKEELTLISSLRETFGIVFPIHRLDAGTGGVIVFARDARSHKSLCLQFEKRLVKKTYIAITKGVPASQTVMLPIGKGNHGRFKINFTSGKCAATSFMTGETNGINALVAATPFTGRTHQIRVHLKALKTPLYQDWLYNADCPDRRLTLFALKTSFLHPISGAKLEISAPLSDFMKSKSEMLGLSTQNMLFNLDASI